MIAELAMIRVAVEQEAEKRRPRLPKRPLEGVNGPFFGQLQSVAIVPGGNKREYTVSPATFTDAGAIVADTSILLKCYAFNPWDNTNASTYRQDPAPYGPSSGLVLIQPVTARAALNRPDRTFLFFDHESHFVDPSHNM